MDFKYNIYIALCMSVTSTKKSKILIHGYENFYTDEPMTLKDLKNNLTNSMISHFFVIYSYFRSMRWFFFSEYWEINIEIPSVFLTICIIFEKHLPNDVCHFQLYL